MLISYWDIWDHIPQHNHWWGGSFWIIDWTPYSQSSSFSPLHHSQLYLLHSSYAQSYAQCIYLLALIFWRPFNALSLFGAHCLIVSVTGEAISLVHHNALVVFLVFNIYILRFLSTMPAKVFGYTCHHDFGEKWVLGSRLLKL